MKRSIPMRAMMSLLLTAVLALPVLAAPEAPTITWTKRFLVSLKPGTTSLQREAALKALKAINARITDRIATDGNSGNEFEAWVVELGNTAGAPAPVAETSTLNPKRIFPQTSLRNAAALATLNNSLIIEESFRTKWIEAEPVSFQAMPMPSLDAVMQGLPRLKLPRFLRPKTPSVSGNIPWGIARVNAPSAWDLGYMGQGARVAVVDSGVDGSHPDLMGRIAGGYNAIVDSSKPNSWNDDNGHGTHVAGTVGAFHADKRSKGVMGVAPKAQLYAVKVLDAQGSGDIQDIVKGIVWCINNKMHVVNMSLGSSVDSELLHKAIRFARARSIVIVAAAGNSGGDVSYPGKYAADGDVITVSASNYEDKIAPFSSRGPEITFIAPGMDVVSTSAGDNDFVSFSGTSMAAPHVTGLAALAIQKGARGIGGPDGVLYRLKRSAKTIDLSKTEEGFGMIDATKVIR